jgi:DNA-binding CsgD family transcriptional regulator
MFDHVTTPSTAWADPLPLLSEREADVLELAAQGLTNSELATRLEITVHTVKFHLASVYRKLGVANRTEAVAVLFRSRARAATRGAEAVG